jgi:hypothetical protein
MVEMMIALSIFGMVLSGVAALYFMSALTTKEIYGPTRARSARMIALNQIRFKLSDGRVASCVFYPDESWRRIRFKDPDVAGGAFSEFLFNPETQTLSYDADVDDGDAPAVVARGPIEITFKPGGNGQGMDALVTVRVATAEELAYANVDIRDGETVVYLRNPPE